MQECFLRKWNGSVYLIKGHSLEEVERKMYVHILAGAPATQRYAQTIRKTIYVSDGTGALRFPQSTSPV